MFFLTDTSDGLAVRPTHQPVHHFSAHRNIFTKAGLITASDIFNCDHLRARSTPPQLEPDLSDSIKFVWTKKIFLSNLSHQTSTSVDVWIDFLGFYSKLPMVSYKWEL